MSRGRSLLGWSGEPGNRRAAAVDLTLLLTTLTGAALLCIALGAPTWLSLLLGGTIGAASTRLRAGERITGAATRRKGG
ncbi:hypothetical protein [Streptomyces crystallinus]|uniref:Uncharacterized protein n=1 Tax=Streptomyces crystallinus TaxID=68191 RepID=A0ABP3S4I7_9ACTN